MLNLKRMSKSSTKALSNKYIQSSNLLVNLNSAGQLLEQYKIAKQYILSNQKNIDPTVLALVYERLLKNTPKSNQIPKRCKLPNKLINLNNKNHKYIKLFLKPSIHNKHLVALNIEYRDLNSIFDANDWTLLLNPQKMSFHKISKFIKFSYSSSIFGLISGLLAALIIMIDAFSYIIFSLSISLSACVTIFMIGIALTLYGSMFFQLIHITLKQSEATSKDMINILNRLINNLTAYIKGNKGILDNIKIKHKIRNISTKSPLQHLKNIKNNGLTWNQIAHELEVKNKDKS